LILWFPRQNESQTREATVSWHNYDSYVGEDLTLDEGEADYCREGCELRHHARDVKLGVDVGTESSCEDASAQARVYFLQVLLH